MLNNPIKNKLNSLIQINIDASKGYRDAASAVSDADLQQIFNLCSLERQHYADQLIAYANVHNAELEADGSIKATLHRTWMILKADATSNNELAIIEECMRGDEEAIDIYNKIIPDSTFIPPVREIVIKQHTAIKKTLSQLKEWQSLLEPKVVYS